MCLFVIYKLIILLLQIGNDSKYYFEKNTFYFDDLKGMIEILFFVVGFMFFCFYNLNYLLYICGYMYKVIIILLINIGIVIDYYLYRVYKEIDQVVNCCL